MKILVTGSSGMIGTNLCLELLKRQIDFIGLDLVPNQWDKDISQATVLADLKTTKWFNLIPDDIDTVIHLAAQARVETSVKNPYQFLENATTLINTLEFTRSRSISKFVFASSKEVYGNLNHKFKTEDKASLNACKNPYAASKLAGEALIKSYHSCYSFSHLIVRFSNVYGPYDMYDRAVPLFIRTCLNNEQLTVYDKNKELDFVYVGDVVEGTLAALDHYQQVKGQSYNLAYGKSTKLLDLAKTVQQVLNKDQAISVKKRKPGEILKFKADISKSKKAFGYNPQVDLETGIELTANWFKGLKKL